MSGRFYTATEAADEHQRDFLSSAKSVAAEEYHCGRMMRPPMGSTFSTHPEGFNASVARRASSAAALTAATARCITEPADDCRGHMPIRAWGCRRVKPIDAVLPVNHQTRLAATGRINKTSLQTVASLPSSAAAVDPVVKAAPKRACGGHTFTLPYTKQYNYYKYYGNAGQNALSSNHHNFPNGHVPMPNQIYSAGAMAASSTVSARDRVQVSEGYQHRYGAIDRPTMSQRDGATQTPMTTVLYDPSAAASARQMASNRAQYAYGASAVGGNAIRVGNFGYGGGQRPPQRAASAHGTYTTSAAVIGNRYAV